MHEYEVAFKLTFQQVDIAMRELTGTAVARWLSVELPEVRNTRVDLLGEAENGDLVHIEPRRNNPQVPYNERPNVAAVANVSRVKAI